jgi:septum site-determining protein MinC
MSAVVCSETVPAALELKSAALTLVAVALKTTDIQALAGELDQRASVMPDLFDDEPVAIDLSAVRESTEAIDFDALLALLRRHRMRPLAVRGGSPMQTAAALAAGLLEAPEGARPAPRELPRPEVIERVVERVVEVQLAPLPPLVVDKPLRSGQQVYARDRDLIVLALVSHGAEVMADGHVHVYAPLRGRAHAGKGGNTDARIFCRCMEAQVLAIAGVHCTTDGALPEGVAFGDATMVRLDGDRIVIEPLG